MPNRLSRIVLRALIALTLVCTGAAVSQSLDVPSQWTGTTSNLSRESRETLAHGAATTLTAYVNPGIPTHPSTGTSPPDLPQLKYFTSALAVLTLQDYYSGNMTWNYTVFNSLLDYRQQYGLYAKPPNTLNSDAIYRGLAFFYAYRTYRQKTLLDYAIEAYNATYMSGFISPTAAESGTGAGRNMSFSAPPGCTKTYAGGVFLNVGVPSNTEIDAYTVAPFLTLSSYLYEETNQTIYKEAAQLSTDFAINHLWNGTVFSRTFNPLTCAEGGDSSTISEWLVEGIAIWANITGNDTLISGSLQNAVPKITSYSLWTLDNGINQDLEAPQPAAYTSIDKGIFIRALAEVRARNPRSALATYIEAYITVQFNAILTRAREPDTDVYTTAWLGPPSSDFTAGGNIAALDILNAAFSFAAPNTSSTSSKQRGPTDAGIIAGCTVGAVVLSFGIVVAFYLWRRRRAERTPITEPFVILSAPTSSNKWNRFYTPRHDEAPVSWIAPSETSPALTTPNHEGHDQGAISELSDQVRRLYDLVQRRDLSGELPPQYND